MIVIHFLLEKRKRQRQRLREREREREKVGELEAEENGWEVGGLGRGHIKPIVIYIHLKSFQSNELTELMA